MKKNLRIVSAAAAALLAVAPIAASAVSTVNAASISSFNGIGSLALKDQAAVNVTPNITFNTAAPSVKASISGSVSASVDGQSYTANFNSDDETTLWGEDAKGGNTIYPGGTTKYSEIKDLQSVTDVNAGKTYYVHVNNLDFNFGSSNANKTITLNFGKNGYFTNGENKGVSEAKVNTGVNGVVHLTNVYLAVTAKDFANPALVNWRNNETGANVSTGNVELYAGSDAGKLNVSAVVAAARAKYYAENSVRPQSSTITYTNNIKDALKAMNIDVDAQGWFVAPKSFNFNLVAKANNNDAESTLPITVSVPNGKEAPVVNEVTKNVTIMHVAAIYDKNGKRTSEAKLGAYNSVSVVAEPVTINGAKFYKLAGKDEYIKVGNVDGTVRTLKHNSYKYKSNLKAYTHKVGKKTKKIVVKSGSEVKTYGSAFKMADGKMYYRIDKNTYIKKANF